MCGWTNDMKNRYCDNPKCDCHVEPWFSGDFYIIDLDYDHEKYRPGKGSGKVERRSQDDYLANVSREAWLKSKGRRCR